MKKLSFLQSTTLMHHIKELALNDLNLANETTNYMVYDGLEVGVLGTTNHGVGHINYVAINPNQSIESFITTVFHESRHVWQIRRFPKYMDKHVVKVVMGLGPKTYWGYYWQLIEIDARVYAWFATKRLSRKIKKLVKQLYAGTLEQRYF